jgi:hypothetical protein
LEGVNGMARKIRFFLYRNYPSLEYFDGYLCYYDLERFRDLPCWLNKIIPKVLTVQSTLRHIYPISKIRIEYKNVNLNCFKEAIIVAVRPTDLVPLEDWRHRNDLSQMFT